MLPSMGACFNECLSALTALLEASALSATSSSTSARATTASATSSATTVLLETSLAQLCGHLIRVGGALAASAGDDDSQRYLRPAAPIHNDDQVCILDFAFFGGLF
jgi:hypothetical protein